MDHSHCIPGSEAPHREKITMSDIVITDKQFHQFRDLIYEVAGISLSDAKRQLVQSRLGKRLRHHNLSSFGDYYDIVISNDAEMTTFVNCITTNKTDFFREGHHFDFVRTRFVPNLVATAKLGRGPKRIRVWHAGCSTGEEPYTMAITLLEALEGEGNWDIKLLASDIDTNVLETAERGIYDGDRITDIPTALRCKYFLRNQTDGEVRYKAKPILQELIKFKPINLTQEPWPIRSDVQFDIVFCRNVIIYFDKPTQKRLFQRFESVLKPDGFLIIGHSESLLGVSGAFNSLGQTIYQLPAPDSNKAAA
jgi:chemotaxis protein methyltransferase CheR